MFQDVDVFSISITGEGAESRNAGKGMQTEPLVCFDQQTSTLKAVHSVEVSCVEPRSRPRPTWVELAS